MRTNMVYQHQLMENPVMSTSHELSYSTGVVLQETTCQNSCTSSAILKMRSETMGSGCDHGSAPAGTSAPSSGGCSTPRPRWCPTPEQIQVLDALFHSGTTTPSREMIVEIAACLRQFGSIVEANVFYWFQNRKARAKRKLRLQQAAAALQQQYLSASVQLGAAGVDQPSEVSSTTNSSENLANLNTGLYPKVAADTSPSSPPDEYAASITEHADQEARPLPHFNDHSREINTANYLYSADRRGTNMIMPSVPVCHQGKPCAFAQMITNMSSRCNCSNIHTSSGGAAEDNISLISPALHTLSSTYNPHVLLQYDTHTDIDPGFQPVPANFQTHLKIQYTPSFKSMPSLSNPVMSSAVMSPRTGSAGNSGDMISSCCSNVQGHAAAAGTILEVSGMQRCRSATISQSGESSILPAVINKPCQSKRTDHQLLADHVGNGLSQDAPYLFSNIIGTINHRHDGLAALGSFPTANLDQLYLEASACGPHQYTNDALNTDITQCTLLSCDPNDQNVIMNTMQPRAQYVQPVQAVRSHTKTNDARNPSFYTVTDHNFETNADTLLPLVGSLMSASDITDGDFACNIKQQDITSPSVAVMHASHLELHDQPASHTYSAGASIQSLARCHHILPLWEALAPYMSIGS